MKAYRYEVPGMRLKKPPRPVRGLSDFAPEGRVDVSAYRSGEVWAIGSPEGT